VRSRHLSDAGKLELDVAADRRLWHRRIQRAEQLASERGPAASLLEFYALLLRQQAIVYDAFETVRPRGTVDQDVELMVDNGLPLVRAVAEHGPDLLVAEARALLETDRVGCGGVLLEYWRTRSDRDLFPKAIVQAYAQWSIDAGIAPIADATQRADNRCPRCSGAPQLSILDSTSATTGDGSARRLQCATCLTMWPFARVRCPSCGEEDERRLGYFHSPALEHVRVDACETCKRYLKTIDLGRLGIADPLVDEVAGAPLDVWAREHGYEKIELNLVGL
jgi:formate dehydrogenase maturation protein FdhE